ncbi:MAG TPA: hypothetical protein VL307_19205 [Chitinophagaceae bacterium]|nr:hypothetical protein [Chitinophagaceae bacterium]
MDEPVLEGKISFVHHDKDYVTIDYTHNNKKKSVNGKVDEARQLQMKEEKLIKKIHRFHEGDEVYFTLQRSARGDKMVAEKIRYRFNNTLGNLVNRARQNNQFSGYLKQVEDKYFVKETGSYQFFELRLSPWELPPPADKLNEPVVFQLNQLDKPEKLYATLLHHHYIPQYLAAQKLFTSKTPLNAAVYKITPNGIYLNLIGDKLRAKIAATGSIMETIKEGDKIKVIITYLSNSKIVVAAL